MRRANLSKFLSIRTSEGTKRTVVAIYTPTSCHDFCPMLSLPRPQRQYFFVGDDLGNYFASTCVQAGLCEYPLVSTFSVLVSRWYFAITFGEYFFSTCFQVVLCDYIW